MCNRPAPSKEGEEPAERPEGDDEPHSYEDEETEEDKEKNKDVVFRFMNKLTQPSKCPASYETFSPFDPDPELMVGMTIFKDYISIPDFEAVLDMTNSIVENYRTIAKRWLILLILGSFGSVFVGIFFHPAAAVSLQLVVLIAHTCAQAYLRKRCPEVCNALFLTEVNPNLQSRRHVFVKVQCETDMCSTWIELDICQSQQALRTGALESDEGGSGSGPSPGRTAPNPLSTGARVRNWQDHHHHSHHHPDERDGGYDGAIHGIPVAQEEAKPAAMPV